MSQLSCSLKWSLPKQRAGRPAATGRRVARFFEVPAAAKRSSVDLSLINTAKSASQIKQVLRRTKDVTAWLTALQQLARMGQHQHGQMAVPPLEAQQRAQLTTKLLSQLSPQVSRLSTGSLCRLCFILSRLQSTTNVTPTWQAAIRQLLQCTVAKPAAAQDPTAAAAREDPTAAATAAAAAFTAAASPGDLLYLLRALEQWEGEDHRHPVLLPAAVAAAATTAELFTLQDLILFVSSLAKMNYYNAQLMDITAARFTAAAAANSTIQQQQQQQQQQQSTRLQQQQQQQQQQVSDSLSSISDQMFVTLLWSYASLAHVSHQQQLLPAALHVLLSTDVALLHPMTQSQRRNSLVRRSGSVKMGSACQQGPRLQNDTEVLQTAVDPDQGLAEPLLLMRLNPKYLPMCAWSLAVMLVCMCAHCSSRHAAAAAAAADHCCNSSSNDAASVTWGNLNPVALNLQQIADLVAAVVGLAELLAAAAAAAAVPSASSSSRIVCSRESGVVYDKEGLAQLHHTRILVAAAAAAASDNVQKQPQPDKDAATATSCSANDISSHCSSSNSSSSSGGGAVSVLHSDDHHASLLQVVQTISQQIKTRMPADLLSGFRVECEAAWSPAQLDTSHTQQQVHQELVRLGFDVQLEQRAVSMLDCSNGQNLPSKQQQQQQCLLNRLDGDAAKLWKVVQTIGANGLCIDIACTVTEVVAQQFQQQGLISVLRQLRDSSSSSSSRSSSSSSVCGGSSDGKCVVLAIEVDGPSHVAVNNMLHQLGSTVCRDLLLQQLGFVVVTVPWWEWDAYLRSSSSSSSSSAQA